MCRKQALHINVVHPAKMSVQVSMAAHYMPHPSLKQSLIILQTAPVIQRDLWSLLGLSFLAVLCYILSDLEHRAQTLRLMWPGVETQWHRTEVAEEDVTATHWLSSPRVLMPNPLFLYTLKAILHSMFDSNCLHLQLKHTIQKNKWNQKSVIKVLHCYLKKG